MGDFRKVALNFGLLALIGETCGGSCKIDKGSYKEVLAKSLKFSSAQSILRNTLRTHGKLIIDFIQAERVRRDDPLPKMCFYDWTTDSLKEKFHNQLIAT